MSDSYDPNAVDCAINASLRECIEALNESSDLSVTELARTGDAVDLEARVDEQNVPVHVQLREDAYFFGTRARLQVNHGQGSQMLGAGWMLMLLLFLVTMNDAAINWTGVFIVALIIGGVAVVVNLMQSGSRREALEVVESVLRLAEHKNRGDEHDENQISDGRFAEDGRQNALGNLSGIPEQH